MFDQGQPGLFRLHRDGVSQDEKGRELSSLSEVSLEKHRSHGPDEEIAARVAAACGSSQLASRMSAQGLTQPVQRSYHD
jgi:hypothetical protein